MIANQFADDFDLNKLNIQQRFMRIYMEINLIWAERNNLNWPNILIYVTEPLILFEIFKKLGYLGKPKEMEKLQHSFIMYEKSDRLEKFLKKLLAEERALKSLESGNYPLLMQQNENNQPSYKDYLNPLGPLKNELFSFGCKVTEDYLAYLVPLMNTTCNFLSPRTKPTGLIRLMTCDNWTEQTIPIYLGCRITEFKCCIDNSQHLFKKLTYSRIGRSGLFISKQGNVISASCLSSTNYENIKNKEVIENIFR